MKHNHFIYLFILFLFFIFIYLYNNFFSPSVYPYVHPSAAIPGRTGRLSEFRCDLIKRSDNTWNLVRKLQETMWAALGKLIMSNYLYGRQWPPTVR